MENKTSDEGTKEPKISQGVLIAIIGAITTIVAASLPWALNRYNSEPSPTPVPLIVTVTSAPVLPTETVFIFPTETITLTPTTEPPTATATPQIGIFNAYLANSLKGVSVSEFKPGQTIYLLFDVNDPTGSNIVTIRWSVVKVVNFKEDAQTSISQHTVTENHFESGFNTPKLPGKYKVELFLNNNIVADETIEFGIVP